MSRGDQLSVWVSIAGLGFVCAGLASKQHNPLAEMAALIVATQALLRAFNVWRSS